MSRRVAAATALALGLVAFATPASASSTDPDGQSAAGASSLASPVPTQAVTPEDALNDTDVASGSYAGDPEAETALVAIEDRRLIDVSLVSKGVLVPDLDVTRPFRVTGTAVSTLVLTPRASAYTLDELSALAPNSIVKGADGVYDINESIAVLKGASLDMHGRSGLTLRLASQEQGFVSLVSLGGTLVIRGTSASPARVTSWDAGASGPDTTTADGRAYIRAMGGQVSLTDAHISDLGFWSGNTGGIALTGLVQTFGLGLGAGNQDGEADGLSGPATETNDGSTSNDPEADTIVTTTNEGIIDEEVGSQLVPEGVTAYLANLTITGNAFGVFAANTSSLELRDSAISQSLIDGVVFHRQVEHSSVEGTSSNDNAADGFRISRGSDSISLQDVTATGNGRNGITINAGPLATGPSAVGLSTRVYGDHKVRDAVVTGNAAAGIAVIGGNTITLTRNRVEGSPFGIVVQDATTNLRIDESTFSDITKQAIALRDGVSGTVTQNVVRGGATGIFLRESVATVDHNTVTSVHGHGVTVVGESEGTVIRANVISGSGTSPIDTARAENVEVPKHSNDVTDWSYQSFTDVVVNNVKRPLTLMWAFLAALLLLTAVSGFRQRKRGMGAPYRDRTPLHLYSRGLVDPTTVPGAHNPLDLSSRTSPTPSVLPRRQPQRDDQTVGV